MKLSIVIASVNERDLPWTVKSIRQTAGDRPEIVVVDDCSASPVKIDSPPIRIIHNPFRMGVGPSRHVGALAATGELLLFTDAHMRFPQGWYEALIARADARPKTLHCCACAGLTSSQTDLAKVSSFYQGATLNVQGPDAQAANKTQIMEVVWKHSETKDDEELQCVMGAGYVIPRKWFLELAPLRFLIGHGGDELQLSLKAWLSGGDVRFVKSVALGHIFPTMEEQSKKFQVEPHLPIFNKIFGIRTLLMDDPLAQQLELAIQRTCSGHSKLWPLLDAMRCVIQTEQAQNRAMFRKSFRWFAERFNIQLP